LAAGPQSYLPNTIRIRGLIRQRSALEPEMEKTAATLIEQGAHLSTDDTLEEAFFLFEQTKNRFIPVVERPEEKSADPILVGALFHVDALRAYNRALVAAHQEEHA
jgi:CIC family chloride channel protein